MINGHSDANSLASQGHDRDFTSPPATDHPNGHHKAEAPGRPVLAHPGCAIVRPDHSIVLPPFERSADEPYEVSVHQAACWAIHYRFHVVVIPTNGFPRKVGRPYTGKNPAGKDWGSIWLTITEFNGKRRHYKGCGYGACLGPGKAPGGGWLIDVEIDGARGEESLTVFLGGECVDAFGWGSARGGHRLFVVDGDRLLSLLAAAGAVEGGRGRRKEPGVWHLPAFPDLELRIGGRHPDGTIKQVQSVMPPTVGSNGQPREFNGIWTIPALPQATYSLLQEIGEKNEVSRAIIPMRSAVGRRNPAASGGTESYGRKALEDEADAFGKCGTGDRHAYLLGMTLRLASLVKAQALAEQEAIVGLRAGARQNGMIEEGRWDEIEDAWRSAMAKATPRQIEDHGGYAHGYAAVAANGAPQSPSKGDGQAKPKPKYANSVGIEAADDPHRLARTVLNTEFTRRRPEEERTVLYHHGQFWNWDGSCHRAVEADEMESKLSRAVKAEFDEVNRIDVEAWIGRGRKNLAGKACSAPECHKVTRPLLGNIESALKGMTIVPGDTEAPAWIAGDAPFDAKEVLPTRNALVHLPGVVELLPHRRPQGVPYDQSKAVVGPTPRFFSTYALDFDFDLDADMPVEWFKFLHSVWPNDSTSIDTLQEYMGYLLTPDTSHQKIGMLIGPTRSGRGTVARVITALIGAENVAGPTMKSLESNFGLSSLIGKPVAIVGDARISGKADWAVVVERLLTISGEDTIEIDRKHKSQWTGRLPTRMVLISNELPRLPDTSGALVGRYLVFRFTKSFLGQEDRSLDSKLEKELPGILLWAIEGWCRLRARGHFLQPASGKPLVDQARALGSPVGAFLDELYMVGPGFEVDVEEMFLDWIRWCEAKRRDPGSEQVFGRDLRTAIPDLEIRRRRGKPELGEKSRIRSYEGVRRKTDDEIAADYPDA